ncbi:hypothetical protein JCM10212_003905 [Sporobolomyces blumeae]
MSTSATLLPVVVALAQATHDALRSRLPPPPLAPPSSSSSSSSRSTPASIASDLGQLLTLVSRDTTNLTLALKPPPDDLATSKLLRDVKDRLSKLGYLETLTRRPTPDDDVEDGDEARSELIKRIRWTLSETLESILHFLQTLPPYLPTPAAAAATRSPSSSSSSSRTPPSRTPPRSTLLQSAKQLWTVLEHQSHALPRTELEASRQCWREVSRLVQDAELELAEIIEGRGGAGKTDLSGSKNGFSDDDEEEEQEEGGQDEVSQGLRQVVEKARELLKFSRVLVNRLVHLTAPPSCPSPESPPSSSSSSAPQTTTTTTTTTRPSLASTTSETTLHGTPHVDDDEYDRFLRSLTGEIKHLSEAADDLACSIEDFEEEEEEEEEGGEEQDEDETKNLELKETVERIHEISTNVFDLYVRRTSRGRRGSTQATAGRRGGGGGRGDENGKEDDADAGEIVKSISDLVFVSDDDKVERSDQGEKRKKAGEDDKGGKDWFDVWDEQRTRTKNELIRLLA